MSSTNNYRILEPTGVLVGSTAQTLMQAVQNALEEKIATIALDLSQVNFIDSSGLGTLVSLHTKVRLAGGKFYLVNPQAQARSLLDISDMDRIFEVYDSRSDFEKLVVKRNQAIIVD